MHTHRLWLEEQWRGVVVPYAQMWLLAAMNRSLLPGCCLDGYLSCGGGGGAKPWACWAGVANGARLATGSLPTWCSCERLLLVQAMPKHRQTMLFTATMTPPLEALQQKILNDPCVVKLLSRLTTASNLKEQYILVPAKVKEVFLMHVLGRLEEFAVRSAIIFCAKKHTCELVGGLLHQLECAAVTLHGDKKQKARLAALHKVWLLIAEVSYLRC